MKKTRIIICALFGLLAGVLYAQTQPRLGNTYVAPSSSTKKKSVENTRVMEVEAPQVDMTPSIEGGTLELPVYPVWNVATLQGKLKMQGLPVSPSLKIYMEKDELIDLSLRAPLVGEVGRLVLTQDTALIVNKMNKTYVKEEISSFLKYYPGGLGDVQNLLLARFFLPGFDLNEIEIAEVLDIYSDGSQFNLVPKGSAKIQGVRYGYVVNEVFQPLALIVMPENRPDVEITAEYNYTLQGYDINLNFTDGNFGSGMVLELKNAEWSGTRPKEINLDNKYRQVTIEEFMRRMSK